MFSHISLKDTTHNTFNLILKLSCKNSTDFYSALHLDSPVNVGCIFLYMCVCVCFVCLLSSMYIFSQHLVRANCRHRAPLLLNTSVYLFLETKCILLHNHGTVTKFVKPTHIVLVFRVLSFVTFFCPLTPPAFSSHVAFSCSDCYPL